jgi:uncharacterized protein with PIN domain
MKISFAAEKTLGKLSKWLRILGFDALYDPEVNGEVFFDNVQGGRILLTRTRRVQAKHGSSRLIFIRANDPFDQLCEVINALGLKFEDTRPFSRCIECNVPIEPVEKESIRNRVPDYVWDTQENFQQCGRCRKIFWPGSHAQRSMQRIQRLFESGEREDVIKGDEGKDRHTVDGH